MPNRKQFFVWCDLGGLIAYADTYEHWNPFHKGWYVSGSLDLDLP